MEYAVVSVAAAPVRKKPDHRKEMVSQLLFGETVKILKTKGEFWVKVKCLHDEYEGWMTHTLLTSIDEDTATTPIQFVTADLLSAISFGNKKIQVPVGSSLPFFENGVGKIVDETYNVAGGIISRDAASFSFEVLEKITLPWLHAPYLWGGRTPLGVDCSGLVQVIFKQLGFDLPRDAWQQAQAGKAVKKFSEVQAGDLAFFNNKEDIVHVGILLGNGKIIHASGKVRIDEIDKKGIINSETGKRTLRLAAVRRVVTL